MKLESNDPQRYLASTEVVTADDPQIRAKASEIIVDAQTDLEKARRLFEWVRDHIPHSNDIGAEVVTCTASEVIQGGSGICFAKSHLLAALCRSVGIPAGFCYQKLRKDPPEQGFILHGFNAIYLESLRRWVRVDARGNKPGVDARFSIEQERLAFMVDIAQGELTYHDVFVEPLPEVVAVLSSHTCLSELWSWLPGEIPRRV